MMIYLWNCLYLYVNLDFFYIYIYTKRFYINEVLKEDSRRKNGKKTKNPAYVFMGIVSMLKRYKTSKKH